MSTDLGDEKWQEFLEVARPYLSPVYPGETTPEAWAATLAGLGIEDMRQEPELVHDTLIAILKTHEDRARVSPETTQRLLGKVA